ncbi:MAG: hypothetical protein Q9181_004861 [Wetmoreana brouardii]
MRNLNTRPLGIHYRAAYDINWLTVANANFGLDVQWKPAQRTSWLGDFIKRVLTDALSLIPVAGPTLAVLFPLAWTLIVDPDSALDELRDLVPGFNLTDKVINTILASMKETEQYLPPNWEQLALPQQKAQKLNPNVPAPQAEPTPEEELETSPAFVIAGDVLARSGREPISEEKLTDKSSTVEVENPPTEFPNEKGEPATFPDNA